MNDIQELIEQMPSNCKSEGNFFYFYTSVESSDVLKARGFSGYDSFDACPFPQAIKLLG